MISTSIGKVRNIPVVSVSRKDMRRLPDFHVLLGNLKINHYASLVTKQNKLYYVSINYGDLFIHR